MKRILLFLFLLTIKANAQKPFTQDELAAVIKAFHPVAKQAALDVRMAKAGITVSRGAFDPEWNTEKGRKEFGGITYYDQQVNELRIPTWYGIDLYAGQETMNGSRINPEETKGALNYVGIAVPLLQNLLMDKRRAQLLQAKNLHELSQVQRQAVLNDLLKEALVAYWEWWEQHQIYQLLQAAMNNAEKRLVMVKTAYSLGDRPAIDTVEASTQVQSFGIRLSEAYTEMVKARLLLSTFLWADNDTQVELPEDAAPQDFKNEQTLTLAELVSSANTHPELVQYNYKLEGLRIERQLKFQSLLPDVRLKYNQTGRDFSKTVNAAWFQNNYRYGISFSLPLRLSEGRGEYSKAKLKMESAKLEQAAKQVQLHTKVKQYYTEWQQTGNQLKLQAGLLNNVLSLQKGEEMRFANGESSLFVINARELKTIETEQKLIELKTKNKKAVVHAQWAAGLLGQ